MREIDKKKTSRTKERLKEKNFKKTDNQQMKFVIKGAPLSFNIQIY